MYTHGRPENHNEKLKDMLFFFMKMTADRKYALIMLLISAISCFAALSLETDFDPVNEKFYPFVLSVFMIIGAIGLFIFPSQHATAWPKKRNIIKICITACTIFLYCLILRRIGFIISASILMGICMWVFEAKRKWIMPVSIITALAFYLVFDLLLGLNLPAGLFTFF